MGKQGFLAALTGAHPYPSKYLDPDVIPVPADFDAFHELILLDELARIGDGSAMSALTNGPSIALSAVLAYGSEEMKDKVCRDVLMGRKMIALAITEPQAGMSLTLVWSLHC